MKSLDVEISPVHVIGRGGCGRDQDVACLVHGPGRAGGELATGQQGQQVSLVFVKAELNIWGTQEEEGI